MTDLPPGGVALPGEFEVVQVDRLTPHPRNPRRGNVGRLELLIRRNGFRGVLQVQRSTGFIVAGNHRYQAAMAIGYTALPVEWLDIDDDEALRHLLGDNRGSDDALYDDVDLAALLSELEASDDQLDGTGYSVADLEVLLERIGADTTPAGHTDPDDAPPRDEVHVVSELGEEWLLGRHRLIVGDSRDPLVVERALGGRLADMLWTDPPYGVDYEGKTADKLKIEGDEASPEDLETLLRAALTNARTWVRPGGAFWVAGPLGPMSACFTRVLTELKVWRQTIVWVKDQFVMGRQDYQHQSEGLFEGITPADGEGELGAPALADLVFAGWRPGAAHIPTPDRKQSNVWEIPRPRASIEHPTMKPVALIERAVRHHTRPGDLVLDCFAGSGSTLIACHRAGRGAALVEKDPVYADVILKRWQAHTGELPRLAGADLGVDFLKGTAG